MVWSWCEDSNFYDGDGGSSHDWSTSADLDVHQFVAVDFAYTSVHDVDAGNRSLFLHLNAGCGSV